MNNTNLILSTALAAVLLTACGSREAAPNSFPGAMIDGEGVFLARGPHLYRYELASGNETWTFPAVADAARAPMAGQPIKVGAAIVFGEGVGAEGRNLYGIDAVSGKELWRFSKPKEWVDGAVTDGKLIFAPNGDGNLYAIDATDNQPKEVWSFPTQNKLWSRPLYANGKLYQGGMDHALYIVDAATGKQIKKLDIAGAPIAVQPTLSDGVLYFGALDSKFYAVNADSGAVIWSFVTNGWIWSEALVTNGKVIFGDVKGRIYALDAKSGKEAWIVDTNDAIHAQPVAKDGTVYVTSFDTKVYALNISDGARVWKDPTDLKYRLPAKPILSGDKLIVPLYDSETLMWAVETANGNKGTQYAPTAAKGK